MIVLTSISPHRHTDTHTPLWVNHWGPETKPGHNFYPEMQIYFLSGRELMLNFLKLIWNTFDSHSYPIFESPQHHENIKHINRSILSLSYQTHINKWSFLFVSTHTHCYTPSLCVCVRVCVCVCVWGLSSSRQEADVTAPSSRTTIGLSHRDVDMTTGSWTMRQRPRRLLSLLHHVICVRPDGGAEGINLWVVRLLYSPHYIIKVI